MRKTTFALAAVAALALPAFVQAQAADTRPGVAVLTFHSAATQADLAPLGKGFQAMLINQLAPNSRIRVVERDQLQRILDEQKLGTSGQLDPTALVRVGKLVGARYMVDGTFITVGSDMVVTVKAFDTETSQIVFTDGSIKGKTADAISLIIQAANLTNTKLNLPQLEPSSAPAREAAATTEKTKKVPFQALLLYSRAVDAEDKGQKADALTLYKQAVAQFPEYDAAKKAVDKLSK
ncbi:MAG TPA: CsgG/HfaB family protein [Gemmatimonadaceae bacterium]|nr:CsgG/HfaB family protein [Gemmatimonadaceae bacterium]